MMLENVFHCTIQFLDFNSERFDYLLMLRGIIMHELILRNDSNTGASDFKHIDLQVILKTHALPYKLAYVLSAYNLTKLWCY